MLLNSILKRLKFFVFACNIEETHAMFIVLDKAMPETRLIDHEVLGVMLWSFFALMV